MQVIHLVSVWSSGSEEESETLHKKLDEMLDKYAAGELEHAAEAISSIWDLSHKREALSSIPRGQVATNAAFPFSAQGWGSCGATQGNNSMRTPLIKSIQGGSLLHRKYWARRSQRGSICPVYFPNVISGSTLLQVAACEWNYIPDGSERAKLDSGRMLQGR